MEATFFAEMQEKDIEKKLKEAESWYDSVKQYF